MSKSQDNKPELIFCECAPVRNAKIQVSCVIYCPKCMAYEHLSCKGIIQKEDIETYQHRWANVECQICSSCYDAKELRFKRYIFSKYGLYNIEGMLNAPKFEWTVDKNDATAESSTQAQTQNLSQHKQEQW